MDGKKIITKLTLDNSSVKKALSETEKTVLKFSAVIAGIGTSMMAAAVYTAQWQDSMTKAARSAGVGVESLSALSIAAEKSNVSTEDLAKSLGKLNNRTPELAGNLSSIGVSMRDANGHFKTSDDLLGNVADAMAKYKNPANQAMVATKVFGEEGAKLVSLLKDGKAGLVAARAEAEKYGLVVSEKAGAAAEKFNDDMVETKNALKGLVSSIGESVIAWTNQGGIMNVVRDTIAGVTKWWRSLSDETKNTIVTIGAVVVGLAALVTAIIAINAILPTLKAILPTLKSGLATAFGPIGLAVMAITVAIGAVITYLGSYSETAKKIFGPLAEAATRAWGAIKSIVENISKIFAPPDDEATQKALERTGKNAAEANKGAGAFAKTMSFLFAVVSTVFQTVAFIVESIGHGIDNASKQITNFSNLVKAKFTGDAAAAKDAVDKMYMQNMVAFEKSNKMLTTFTAGVTKTFTAAFDTKITMKFDTGKTKKNAEAPIPEIQKSYSALGLDISQSMIQGGKGVTLGYTKFANEMMTHADRVKKGVSELLGYFSGIGDAVKAVTAAVTGASKYNTAVQLRDLEVLEIRSKKAYDDMRAAAEAEEAAKTAALAKSYDDQINTIKDAEAEKTAAIEFESKQRLLLNDQEYQTAKAQAEAAHAAFMEAERARFESEKMLMDEKTVDKEQRRLNESVMDANWDAYVKSQEGLLQQQLNDLAKNSGDKKTKIESESKAKITAITGTNAEQVKALEIAKAAALQKNEEDKNKRMAAIDAARTAQEKAEEIKRLQISYDAEVQEFQQTKAMKIIETTVGGIAAAAAAFGSMAELGPFGLAIGAGLAATIIGATAASVSQISSQNPVKPAALLAEDGGLLSGPRHAQGGIPVNAEGGELITSRGRTKALFDAMDSGGMGGVNINVNIGDGAIQAVGLDGSALAEMIGDMVSEKVGNEVRRLGIVGA